MLFNDFVNQYFNGDKEAAFAQIAYESYNRDYKFTGTHQNLKNLLDQLSPEDASRYMKFSGREMAKNPERFAKTIELGFDLSVLKMSYDEVKNAEINPYKAQIGRSFLKFLIGMGGFTTVVAIASAVGATGVIPLVSGGMFTLFSTYASADLGNKIMKYFKFKKVKKKVLEEEEMKNEGRRL